MAAPTAPTLTTLATEGLKKAGYNSPGSSYIDRAEDYFMEEIKNDIHTLAKDMRSLQKVITIAIDHGRQRYSFPADFNGKLLTAVLCDGDSTGTAQDGTSGSITLAASETFTQAWLRGKEIAITGGTGTGSISQVIDYNTTTKVASVAPNWGESNPGTGDTYMVIERYTPLDIHPVHSWDNMVWNGQTHKPYEIYPIGDQDYDEFVLGPHAPDDDYVLKIRYFANLMTLDLTSTLLATLYLKWRNIWIQGVCTKQLQDDDDDRQDKEFTKYIQMLKILVGAEKYGYDLSALQVTIGD